MYGLEINLLMDTEQNSNNSNISAFPNLIWSSYDRISFKKVTSFKEYFHADRDITIWTGNVQSMHLFCDDIGKSKLCVNDIRTSGIYLSNANRPDKEYAFGMIVSIKINERIFCKSCISNNKDIKEFIHKSIEKRYPDVFINLFFSLGEEDLVLLALGNSIDDFLNIVGFLRRIECNDGFFCIQTNSFVFQNSSTYSSATDNKLAYACVYLSLNEPLNEKLFCDSFIKVVKKLIPCCNNIEPSLLIGEYDLMYTFPASVINSNFYKLYMNKCISADNEELNILNSCSNFYKQNIKKSKTVWCCNVNELQQNGKVKYEPKSSVMHEKTVFTDVSVDVDKINELIGKLIQKISGIIDNQNNYNLTFVYRNVISFLNEAKLTLNSLKNGQWKYIVAKQIEAFVEAYNDYESILPTSNIFINSLNTLISNMSDSFYHINRSREMFYNIPANSLQYSGSYNAILLAYYSYINKLMELAFKKPHNTARGTKQSNVVFFIYFSMSPKIRSHVYFNNNDAPNGHKIVGFELPYFALYDFNKYFISLTHEVYHMIAPYDRNERNNNLIVLWKLAYIKNELLRYIEYKIPDLAIFKKSSAPKRDITDNESDSNWLDISYLHNLIEDFVLTDAVSITDLDTYNIDNLNYTTLNEAILERLTRDDIEEYYSCLMQKLRIYCNDYLESKEMGEEARKLAIFLCEHINELNNIDTSHGVFTYDKNQLRRVSSLLMCAKECICDTYTIQLAYKKSVTPLNESVCRYIKYLLQLFKEIKVEYNTNQDAINRIYFLFRYNNMQLSKAELCHEFGNRDGEIIYEIVASRRCSIREEEQMDLIINGDDFLSVCARYLSTEEFEKRLDANMLLKSIYILPITYMDDSEDEEVFEKILNIIMNLNAPFTFVKYKEAENNSEQIRRNVQRNLSSDKSKDDNYHNMRTCYVSDFEAFFRTIRDFSKNKDMVWYRGICNAEYKLLPSLYVNLPDKRTIPYYYQLALLRQSYYQTRKNYYAFTDNEIPLAARQSLMQHYGVPTNFLDFSTDPLAALFWAMNPERKTDQVADMSSGAIPAAVVYLFYPHIYKKACEYIKENIPFTKRQEGIYSIYSHGCLDEDYVIRKEIDCEADKKVKKYNRTTKLYHLTKQEKYLYKELPMPIVVPQKNHRINAQSGTFVAFNFFHIPVGGKDENVSACGQFNYISLGDIQEKYAKLCVKNGIRPKHLFLERIIVDPYAKNDIRRTLDDVFDYSMEKVYPDLPHLLKDVKKNTYGYSNP